MRATILRGSLIFFAWVGIYGQSFEAASVKPAAAPVPDGRGRIMISGPSGGPGTKDPGRIRYPFMSLKSIMVIAYDVKAYQISGPAWLDTERFDITATLPPDTTKEQFHVMLQNLLAERFKVAIHRETKELPMYSLVLAKSGLKMKESVEETAPKPVDSDASLPPMPMQPKMGPDGFPIMPAMPGGRGGLMMMMMPGRARLSGQHQTVQDLASRLTSQLGRPVTDATGLQGKYDITLTFSTEGMNGPMGPMGPMPPAGGTAVAVAGPAGGGGRGDGVFIPEGEAPPDIFAAVQSQLGLKLESKKGPVELIVVDHAEKTPTEN